MATRTEANAACIRVDSASFMGPTDSLAPFHIRQLGLDNHVGCPHVSFSIGFSVPGVDVSFPKTESNAFNI
jgi:hypothetical protein